MKAIVEPLRYGVFRRVWLGQLINIIGDAIFAVAVVLYLLPRPDPAATIGLVLGATALGGVVSLIVGGALADRHRRSRIVIAADLIRAFGLALLLLFGPQASTWALAGAAAVMGVGTGLYRPAYLSLLPTLVPEEALAGANAIRTLTTRFAVIIGSGLGGLLAVWFTPRSILTIDLVTFLVSILTLVGVHDTSPKDRDEERSIAHDVALGFRYVLARPWISAVMLQGTLQVAFVAGPIMVCLPLVLGEDGGGGWYGLALAGEGVGAVAGASLAAARTFRSRGMVAMLALLCQTPQVVTLALDGPPMLLVVFSALAGVGLSMFAVLWTTALQQQVTRSHLGRVMAMDQLTATALSPVGLSLSGWLVLTFGVSAVAWIATAVLIGSVLAVLPVTGVFTFGRTRGPTDRPDEVAV